MSLPKEVSISKGTSHNQDAPLYFQANPEPIIPLSPQTLYNPPSAVQTLAAGMMVGLEKAGSFGPAFAGACP